MTTTNRFDHIDYAMSCSVVRGTLGKTTFYVTDLGYTDMISRAKLFRLPQDAEFCARLVNATDSHFNWESVTYPRAATDAA